MRMKYDLVVGLGPACSCSQTLRRAGLQLLSFPFDWIVPGVKSSPTLRHAGWDGDVRRRADLLAAGFGDWMAQGDFECHGPHTNGMDKYFNTRFGWMFLHDFPQGVPISESFPAVKAKYARRADRLVGLLRRSKRVLLVRLDHLDPECRTPEDDCRYARATLSRAFAPAEFDFLLLQPNASIPFGSQRFETIEPGFFRLRFDYADTRPGMTPMYPRLDFTADAVAEHFAVQEYRSKAEIAAHRETERKKRWAKYGATNVWQYRWRKFLSRRFGIHHASP